MTHHHLTHREVAEADQVAAMLRDSTYPEYTPWQVEFYGRKCKVVRLLRYANGSVLKQSDSEDAHLGWHSTPTLYSTLAQAQSRADELNSGVRGRSEG